MLGELAKRLVNAAVVVLAAFTFFLVPMGRKTLAQHAVAVLGAAPAREAADACADVGRRLVASVRRRGEPEKPPAPPPEELMPAD